MPAYDIAVASLAIQAPIKWTDNVLSQHVVAGVVPARRGKARRIPYPTLLHLALTRDLHSALGLSVRDALELARLLLADSEEGVVERGVVRIRLDRAALERALDHRLRDALESAPSLRRGPPRRRAAK
jgi:hypothetical protein